MPDHEQSEGSAALSARPLREFFMKAGPSTRPTTLRTGERVVFARTALDDAVAQVATQFMPMTVEHLSYLPPIGRIVGAEVREAPDGHADLYFHGKELPSGWTRDLALPASFNSVDYYDGPIEGIEVSAEPRNFSSADWKTFEETAPLQLNRHAAWSALPPLIWLITVPVVWGVTQFAGGFLQRLGESTAERLATWVANAGSRAKDSHRENLVHVRFETPGGMVVSAYVPLAVNSATAVAELREALENLGPVAQFAGAMAEGEIPDVVLSAFFYTAGTWNLGWWASPGQVYISPWFSKNYPDPQRFLGHPALADVNEPSTPQQDLPLPPHESE